MAAAAAEEQIPSPSPPTYRFRPTKRELVSFYLLPCARGQDPFPGVLLEDDAAGSTLPWDLFERHGVGGEDEAYFIVRGTGEGKGKGKRSSGGARQDRGCDGGVGIWKMQSSHDKCLRVRGERIRVHVSNLSLHMGRGRSSGGSVGWVMHEYSIAAPPCPSPVKICHIAFSGHGRKRMRVPDPLGQEVCQQSSGGGRARVGDTVSSALPCSGAMLDHGCSGVPYASGDEEFPHLVLADDDTFRQGPLLGSSDDLQCFPSAASEQYPDLEVQVPTTEQQGIVMPQSVVQQSTMPLQSVVHQQSTMPVAQQLSAAELEFWSSIGVDVQSNNSFDQEEPTGVQSNWVVPIGAMATGVQSSCVVSSNGAMATGVQSSLVVPNNGTMATAVQRSCAVSSNSAMATGVQSSCVVPSNGGMATGVQSSWVVPNNGAMARGVQSNCAVPSNGATATGVQSSCAVSSNGTMATGFQSSWVVPNNDDAIARELDEFCKRVLGTVPTNCAAPDYGNMATRTLGGGCSLIC